MNTSDRIFSLIFILLIVVLMASCDRAKYNECRRFHPRWYCIDFVLGTR